MRQYLLNREQIESIVHITRNCQQPELFDLFTKVLEDPIYSHSIHADCLRYFLGYAEVDKDKVFQTLRQVALLPTTNKDLVVLIIRYLIFIKPNPEYIMEVIEEMPTNRIAYIKKQLSTPP